MAPAEVSDVLTRLVAAQGGSPRVAAAFREVPRALFVPATHRGEANHDEPIPIPHGQVTTQPTLIARMLDALALTGTEVVLEVGTGLGFQTALLSRLCARVCSIEWFADLSQAARENLERAGAANVTLAVGDGTLGLPEHAPFDAIVASAAAARVPPAWTEQLREDGRLVMPVGPGGRDWVTAYRKRRGRLVESGRLVFACFVPMAGRCR